MNTAIIRNDATGIPDRNIYSTIIELLKLQKVKVENGQLTVGDLEKVEYLHVESPMDLEGIHHCVNLKTLVIANTEISDITPVNKLKNLTCLSLACNEIEDLGPIAEMVQLERLYLGHNKIVDISPLKGLINLERLSLRGNEIVDIRPLAGLSKLIDLSLEQNEIVDITPLASLVNISSLNISENDIADITALEHVYNMKYLYMGYNDINDLSSLVGMMNLEKLELEGNYLTIEDVDQNLFQEFAMDPAWLEANGLEIESFESSIEDTLQGMKQKVWDRPKVTREWNEDTLDMVQKKKNLSLIILGVVTVVGALYILLKRKK